MLPYSVISNAYYLCTAFISVKSEHSATQQTTVALHDEGCSHIDPALLGTVQSMYAANARCAILPWLLSVV